MNNYHKAFLRGIICASLTWAVSLYLYWLLTSSNDSSSSDLTRVDSFAHPHFSKIGDFDDSIHKSESNIHRDAINSILHDRKYDNNYGKKGSKSENRIKYEFKKAHKNERESNVKSLSNPSDPYRLENTYGYIRTYEDKIVRDEGYRVHAFNTLVSQRIGDTRAVPDTRNELCESQTYPEKLPDVSVIICFYNEHYETLRRSVQSVLNQTPHSLLTEIVLVDDFSSIENLHSKLEKYVDEVSNSLLKKVSLNENNVENADLLNNNKIVKIKLFKTSRREGLIRARLFGANNSVGTVMVFLDSHIEVNKDWLQPMLTRLAENITTDELWSSRVVMPIIDIINADTFQYKSSPLVRGGFNWGLHYKWDNLPKGTLKTKEDFIKPLKSPTMAGGLFAIYRKYFDYIGKYDPGMDTWGGENLELSFRVWMCGGTLEIIPCSRVGHVFRKRRPYGSDNGVDSMLHNSLRLAHVWMDSYVNHYLKTVPNAASVNYGDISDRVTLRKSLDCKSFQWYLDNVYPELILDTDNESKVKQKLHAVSDQRNVYQPWHSRKRDYVATFQIKLTNSTLCVHPSKDMKTKGGTLMLGTCTKFVNQVWYETALKELVLGKLLCLEAPQSSEGRPTISKCHEMAGNQEWHRKSKNNDMIYNTASGTCLGVDDKLMNTPIVMKICSNSNYVFWDFIYS